MRQAEGALPASGAALLILLCACWGIAQVAVKLGLEGISPLVQAGLRSVVAVPLLLGWCWWRGIAVRFGDGSLWPGLLCGVLFAGEFWALYEALARTTAARSTVLLFMSPFWAVLGAHWLVPGDRLTARKLAGLLLAFAGLLVAFTGRLGGPADAMLLGDLLALLAGMLWGATIVVIKATMLTRIPAERTLLYQIGTALLLLPIGYALGEPGVFAPTPLVWGALLFQGAGIAFASYVAWFWLVARHKASALAPFLFLTPVFAVAAGAVVLAEPVTPALLGSLALIGAGIWVVNRG
ncbi:DMT family transporter [Falsiroseomonas oryzae]|uniref:DMT family transporter n=1 Tax=Falsiroseomonas oryzae TaxID=2766473 RepID=UPI0022EB413A|nr:DMT family transporter [Roseomonas sp. MO-31]